MANTLARLPMMAANAPWVTIALVICVSTLIVKDRARHAAFSVLTEHLVAVTNPSSGGILFVLSPMDCIDARDEITTLATIARGNGLAVRGLVIEDGLPDAELRAVLREANQRFPHYPVSMQTAALVANMFGVGQTPMLLSANRATGIVGVAPLGEAEQLLTLALSHKETIG